jgi:hypothetical protein
MRGSFNTGSFDAVQLIVSECQEDCEDDYIVVNEFLNSFEASIF